jgi:predicted Abi (CAAX) family protease
MIHRRAGRTPHRGGRRRWWLIGLAVLSCCLTWLSWPLLPNAYSQVPGIEAWDLANYPAQQVPGEHYRSVAAWSGRLILPDQAAAEADDMDWVWMDVYTSPNPELIGRRVRLQWQDTPENRQFLDLVTRGIEFDEVALASIRKGRVHPTRLNGWSQVGPLQSLAGARPEDDVLVALPIDGVQVDPTTSVVAIDAIPIQIPERFYGLVKVLGPAQDQPVPQTCPGSTACHSDYKQVQHYNPATGAFDGAIETVRLPQVSAHADGVFQSSSQDLASSPAGEAGWYIYGARNTEGTFVVRAIAPRRLFQLQPQTTITGVQNGLNYINFGNWRDTPDRKGTIASVFVTPDAETAPLETWQEGDRLLVIHLFGGIGGDKAEPRSVPGTVTGHYAYGVGEVIRDPFTQELQLWVLYNQVYSHNPLGIVAGRVLWSEFTGNLQRGWLGARPVSDVLVKIPALTHTYQFGQVTLNPFAEFQRELVVMMARYRTGDGTGAAIVTPAQSCVQDSSQALYETIQAIRDRVAAAPEVTAWLAEHPTDPQTQLFQELIELGQQLQKELVPLGIARPDWHENADVLAGIQEGGVADGTLSLWSDVPTVVKNVLSWRTVIPRVAHDNVTAILLNHGAEMWFLRTNQVGGQDPTMVPLAPTELLGDYEVIPTAFSRVIEGLKWPNQKDIGIVALGWGAFAIALFLGASEQFGVTGETLTNPAFTLEPTASDLSLKTILGAVLAPALWQEFVFRVLLLPHPTEGVRPVTAMIWIGVSLGLFFLFHRLKAHDLWPWKAMPARLTHRLYLVFILGVLATVIYLSTGSLWTVTGFHWGAWLLFISRDRWLSPSAAKARQL